MRFSATFLFFSLLSLGLGRTAGADEPKVKLRVTFAGQPFEWEETVPDDTPASWDELSDVANKQARVAAHQVAYLADKFAVADYGKLLLVRDLARGIPVDNGDTVPRTFHGSVGNYWNALSRAFFVSAVLNRMGYPAVVFEKDGKGLVGLPIDDHGYNARTQRLYIERRFLGLSRAVDARYLLWDVDGRIGAPEISSGEATLRTPVSTVFDTAGGRRFDFRSRSVPSSLYARTKHALFEWPDGNAVSYTLYPAAAEYLALYPEFHFAAQLQLERADFKRTGLAAAIRQLDADDEAQFVTAALRAVQKHFEYVGGPLQSVHAILQSRQGDCDQLALILGLLLLDNGYAADALAAVLWEDADHLGLLLRPRTAVRLTDGVAYSIGGRAYYVLDVTYYHRRDTGELMTTWGEMNPDNRDRTPTIERIGERS